MSAGTGGAGRWRSGIAMLAIGLMGLLAGGPAAVHAAPPPGDSNLPPRTEYTEQEVKAAILVGFARTTDWPAGTFPTEPRTLTIGLYGHDTLGDQALAAFRQLPSTGMQVRFTVVSNDTAAAGCHLLFIPRSERRRAREIVDQLKGRPVLIVGEADDFLDQGGMVNLIPREGKMKFEIDLNAAKAANLRIPARVLASALKVRGRYD